MARDKQLIIRLEQALRDDFGVFCTAQNTTASGLLYDIVKRLTSGELSIDTALGTSAIPANIDSIVAKAIDSANHVPMERFDAAIASLVSRLEKIEKKSLALR